MKRMWWFIVLLLSADLLLTGCAALRTNVKDTLQQMTDSDDVDGGVRIDAGTDAPKVIESTRITSFSCDFSGYTMSRTDTRLAGRKYRLEAVLTDGKVTGSYYAYNSDGGEPAAFTADETFMESLQQIVAAHDLAQYNGQSYTVSGLAPDYGAKLSIGYDSGESIYASNNQSCFLSFAALEALESLFAAQIAPPPELLDLSVAKEFELENIDGHYVSISYPVLTLGYASWDGKYHGAEGFDALSDALDRYNMSIRMDIENKRNYTLRPEAQHADENTPTELYAEADVYVCRNDDCVVSFWESVTWATGQTGEMTFRRTYNYDAKTGETLGYADVFTYPDALPELLAQKFAEAYPDLNPNADIESVIADSLEKENGLVCFALTNGGIYFFAEKNPLDGLNTGILQITLLSKEYPELIKPEYRDTPADFMMKLAYDADNVLPDGMVLQMSWDIPDEDSMDIMWTIDVGGNSYSETFYGYAPECHVVYTNNTAYLYLRIPVGDVTNRTAIYRIAENGLVRLGEADIAMCEELNYHPDRILMLTNDIIYSGYALLQPYGLYRIDENGMPVLISEDVFGLRGPTLSLTQDVEATSADMTDETFADGPILLAAGMLLTPYRTDKKTYIDFIDPYGNVCRFAIDCYTDEMVLNGYGTMEELFTTFEAVG